MAFWHILVPAILGAITDDDPIEGALKGAAVGYLGGQVFGAGGAGGASGTGATLTNTTPPVIADMSGTTLVPPPQVFGASGASGVSGASVTGPRPGQCGSN